jgi:hypothetical protein
MKKDSRYWIEVPGVHMTLKEMTAHFGKRCKEFEPGCGCCEGWKQWDQDNKVTLLIDRPTLLGLTD